MTLVFPPRLGWKIFWGFFVIATFSLGIWQLLDQTQSSEYRIYIGGMCCTIGLFGALGWALMPSVTVTEESIESSTIFGKKKIAWVSVIELARQGRGDTVFQIKSNESRVSVSCEFAERGDQLRAILLKRVKEQELPAQLIWTPFQRFPGLFFGCTFIFLIFIAGSFWLTFYGNRTSGWLCVGSMSTCLLWFSMYMFGTFWVTEESVRADVILGWRREIPWEQIVELDLGTVGEGDQEAILIRGVKGKIQFDSASTPHYAQVRDLILRRAKSRSQLL